MATALSSRLWTRFTDLRRSLVLAALAAGAASCGGESTPSEPIGKDGQNLTGESALSTLATSLSVQASKSNLTWRPGAPLDYRVPAQPLAAEPKAATLAAQVVPTVPDGATVAYSSIMGTMYTMRRFNGKHTALLIEPSALDTIGLARVRQMLDEHDILYETLQVVTNGEPNGMDDLLHIAIVPETCPGAIGCGWLGWNGLEVVTDLLDDPGYIQVTLHEMLHNFDRLSDYLFNSPDKAHSWTVFTEWYVENYLQKVAFGLNPVDQLDRNVRDALNGFESYPGSNWEMCVRRAECGQDGGMAVATEGGVLLRATQLHGAAAMRGWAAMVDQLIARDGWESWNMTPEQRVDLLEESIARSVQKNTSCYFDFWRWPVSGLVRGPLEQAFGVQNANCIDNDHDGFTEIAHDCNDANAAVNPNAVETVNGVDNDCDGAVDDLPYNEASEAGGDFPNDPGSARNIASDAHILGSMATNDDVDFFKFHLNAAATMRFTFTSLRMRENPPTFTGWLWVIDPSGSAVASEWLWEGANKIFKPTLSAGDWTLLVAGNAGPYEIISQHDYVIPMAQDQWPVTFTPRAASPVTGQPNRYRVPVPTVQPPLLGTPGLMARFWIQRFGFVGEVPATSTTPFDWVAPAGTSPLDLTYRVQFTASQTPVYPTSQYEPLLGPRSWYSIDVGSVGQSGSFMRFDDADLTVVGAGANIGGNADAFRFAYQTWSGNVEVIARVVSLQPSDPSAMAGVMIRDSANPGSRNALMAINASNALTFQRRTSTGGGTTTTPAGMATPPYWWVRLVRRGSAITAYSSADGTSWAPAGSASMSMASTVSAGIAVTSHTTALTASAGVDHVVVRTPQ